MFYCHHHPTKFFLLQDDELYICRPYSIYQYAFMHMQVDGEVTRCNDNSRHLFSLSLLALNRNQRLITLLYSQDAITTIKECFSMPFTYQEEDGAYLVCMIVLFRIIHVHNGESFNGAACCGVYL